MDLYKLALTGVVIALGLAAGGPAPAQTPQPAVKYAAIPVGEDNDLTLYRSDGRIVKGAEALGRMPKEAQLILWLAGNQFFAMDDVIHAFQKQNPKLNVGLITLPTGLIVTAIQKGGWSYGGVDYPGLPDVYNSVNLEHLKTLKQGGFMDTYAIYIHNELVLMVAKGNPKNIKGIDDLARPDVRTSLPNPVNEGIMQFYVRKVLERHGVWHRIAAGQECFRCQTTPNNWFTAVHHRETPARIRDGQSDVGIVWKTELIEARHTGLDMDGVPLPPEDSLRNEVSYAIGPLSAAQHKDSARRYLAFLAGPAGQGTYTKFGFIAASADELKLKPIP